MKNIASRILSRTGPALLIAGLTVVSLWPLLAGAQTNDMAPAAPYLPPRPLPTTNGPTPPANFYQALIRGHRPSPTWTQDRNFTSTRFWLLDPGQFEVETWVDIRIQPSLMGVRAPASMLFQQEIEIGLVPHLQLDLYENIAANVTNDGSGNAGSRSVQQDGVQLELRIAIPSYYGQIFGNPVIYLEFRPRHLDPDRFEIRLLLGGALSERVFLAINPYFETNVEATPIATQAQVGQPLDSLSTSNRFIMDAEVGATAAIGVKVTDWLRLSAQAKIGADMLGNPTSNSFNFVGWVGPGFILKPLPGKNAQYLKIMGTVMFSVLPDSHWENMGVSAQQYEPFLIVGSQF